MSKIEKLKKEDYDDLLSFLNEAFECEKGNGFLEKLPIMWRRTDDTIGKNYAIRENNKIVACTGIYPLQFNVAGEKIVVATTGNIAVDKDYRSKGLMKQLMVMTHEELIKQNIDVARLGGLRQRYNRYGYEPAGDCIYCTLLEKNITNGVYGKGTTYESKITFTKISKSDKDILREIKHIQEQSICFVDRHSEEDFYDIMCAWGNIPYVAMEGKKIVGALVASKDFKDIAEVYGIDAKTKFDVLCAWVMENKINGCTFTAPVYEKEFIRLANNLCEYVHEGYITNIKVINYVHFINALLKLKGKTEAGFSEISGSFVLDIEDYGKVKISSTSCEKTTEKADLTIDKLTANRFLFGYQKIDDIIELPKGKESIIKAILPLPFWWNGQDRV